MKVRTRFAPSPTGNLHLGSIRTAFYSWLYAQSKEGEFILRIEDTDQERSTQESTKIILDSMDWLGLNYDQGPIYQTKRLDLYRQAAEKLIDQGLAYRCYCSRERIDELREKQLANKEKPRYDGCCRDKNLPATDKHPYVIRFKNPQDGIVTFVDQVLGELSFNNNELDDLIIIRSDRFPTYNFCVVVDDLEMEITHVIRGADHVNNTPRQINIFRAFGATPPEYAHVPLILGNDGKLLSKRHGAASVLQYRDEGYLKEAILNYLVRLGWSHGNQEIFSLDEMVKLFDVQDINKAAAAFDPEKFLWLNRHYLKTIDPKLIAKELSFQLQRLNLDYQNGPAPEEVVLALRERSDTLQDMAQKSHYFYVEPLYQEDAKKYLNKEAIPFIKAFHTALIELVEWNDESIHKLLEDTAEQFALKLGKIAQPIRVAVTGTTVSPPLNTTIRLIGKVKVLCRLLKAIDCAGSVDDLA